MLPPRYIRRKIKGKNEDAVRFSILEFNKDLSRELVFVLVVVVRRKTGIKGLSRHLACCQ